MRFLRRVIAGVVGMVLCAGGVAACSGHVGSSCSSDGDCESGLSCEGPNGPPSCGIPPMHGCMTSSDCTGGEVCHSVTDPCSPTGLGSECGPPCTGACGADMRCDAQGACKPIPCDQGFACPSYQRCDPSGGQATGPVFDDDHGCVSIPCQADSGCPAGAACVNAICQSGPGQCVKPEEVP